MRESSMRECGMINHYHFGVTTVEFVVGDTHDHYVVTFQADASHR